MSPPADLSQSLRLQGRASAPIEAAMRRTLGEADLALLDQPRPSGEALELKRISDRHHLLARSLAAGMSVTEAAVRTGISLNRVSILKSDPAMTDLISHYRGIADAAFGDLHEKLGSLAQDAVGVLHDRLEEDPSAFSLDALIEVGKFAADRSGHGPSTKSTVNIKIDLAERLQAARRRVHEGQTNALVIEHQATVAPAITSGESND